MELAAYLDQHDLTARAFAAKVGVNPSMVTRWRLRQTIPEPDNIRAIMLATDGSVTANDFYSCPADERESAVA